MIKKRIKLSIIIPIVLTGAVMVSAQLLPQKQENNSVKIDRALIFKVDYEDETVAPDTTSKKDTPTKEEKKKKDPLANSILEVGTCITASVLLDIFNGGIHTGCIPLPSP